MALFDHSEELASLRTRLTEARRYLKYEDLLDSQARLEAQVSDPDLWNDPDEARKVTGQLSQVNDDLGALTALESLLGDVETLYELGVEEGDDSIGPELAEGLAQIDLKLGQLELRSLFTGEYDDHDAIFEIHSGAGGVDAQDWAEMLLRMYTRWATNKGFDVEVEHVGEANEAGINSATLIIKGRYAYGLLSAERGTHRLVRISPFDSQARRQTSFAGVAVTPMIEEAETDIVVEEKDIKVDVFRSSGAGGQHINTTDSAVRFTHLATGIVVSCQIERSQIQNRARCMIMLKAKLAERARLEHELKLSNITGATTDAAWGNQIRSYVMAPYQMVKDLRSEYETGNVAGVLDGDLDALMESWLRWRRAESENP